MELDFPSRLAAQIAPAACTSCKDRKQKCDKSMPSCARCERLLLTCRYSTQSHNPINTDTLNLKLTLNNGRPPPFSSLIRDLTAATRDNQAYHSLICNLINIHKAIFNELVLAYFSSYHKWMPIVRREYFLDRWNGATPDTSRGFTALVLAICSMSPLETGDGLETALPEALKRLFWDSDSMAKPTLAWIQAGVLLSCYEYTQGEMHTAYITIGVCLSMAEVGGLCPSYQPLGLPSTWTATQPGDNEALSTWWGILIHQRMISLKLGTPISPIQNRSLPFDYIENPTPESEDIDIDIDDDPDHSPDPIAFAFHQEIRATIFLDQVLELTRKPHPISIEGQDELQSLDQNLLSFLTCLIENKLGGCCEALAIGLSAFIHLHHWHLSAHSNFSSSHLKTDSPGAIDTVIKLMVDTAAATLDWTNGFAEGKTPNIPCQSPYSMYMIYQLAAYMKELRNHSLDAELYEGELKMLKRMLELRKGRWKMADEYVTLLAER